MRFSVFVILSILFSFELCAQTSFATSIDSLISTLPQESEVGIAVYDLTSNEMLYTFRDHKLARPASTMKLLTTITALSYLDVEKPFHTDVWTKGVIENDTLKGDLYVLGGFDPEFDDEAMNALLGEISTLPFKVITGKVYGDISMKDSLYWGAGWLWDDNPEAFQPYLSPLMFNKGMITVGVTPANSKGVAPQVAITPKSTYYTVNNSAKTRTPSAGAFNITRDWMNNKNEILINGNLAQAQSRDLNVYGSSDFFMHTFLERLQANNISVLGGYDYKTFHRDSLSTKIATYHTSFQKVIDQTLKESDNLNAEALLYRIAAKTTSKKHVSAKDGLQAVNRLIKQIGLNPSDYKIADGSGLSNYNYISPALLVELLKYAYANTNIFGRLYKALPTAGIEGTVKHRMKPGKAFKNVHAKTGSYTGINALAGYAKAANGHYLAFAIMNQNILSGRKARIFQDQLCEIMCQ